MKIKPILRKEFYHEGRGPELQKVHYDNRGRLLKAIDYFNPDDEYVPLIRQKGMRIGNYHNSLNDSGSEIEIEATSLFC